MYHQHDVFSLSRRSYEAVESLKPDTSKGQHEGLAESDAAA
jgi:hypothetical protein